MLVFFLLLTSSIWNQRVQCFSLSGGLSLHVSKLRLRMVDPNNNNNYSPLISLIREGPIPFFIRLTQPAAYDAAVESLMAERNWDRTLAQSSIDSYYKVTAKNTEQLIKSLKITFFVIRIQMAGNIESAQKNISVR